MTHELYAEFGPLLIFDASSQRRWESQTFNSFVLGDGERPEAEAGYCVWLACDGMRQFSGRVELLVEEATPAHVEFAHQHSQNLWLRVPTGKLVLSGRAAVLPESERSGESPRLEFDVPPGDYAVDAWAYEPHEIRLEEAELPGDPPRPKWAGLTEVATWVAVLVSFAALVSFFMLSAWPSLLAIVAAWSVVFVVGRVTGSSAHQKAMNTNLERTIAALPPIPDFTARLRRVEVPPPSGGGVSN